MRDGNETRRREELARLAERQHGAVSLTQLEALGYSRSAVHRRSRDGSLRRVFPGVYRIAGSRPTLEQRAVASLLWAGEGAVASHVTAAALWGLAPRACKLHVTTTRTLTSPPARVCTHTSHLARRDRGRLRGIAVTSVGRTLLDLAVATPEECLLPVVERSILERLVTADQVQDVVRRNAGRRGSRRLADVLGPAGSSALERRVENLLRGSGLPPHQREFPLGRLRLDFAWPGAKVAVEADGRRWHSSARDFERDRAKNNFLTDRGWRVLRATARDLDDPGPFLDALARLLTGAR